MVQDRSERLPILLDAIASKFRPVARRRYSSPPAPFGAARSFPQVHFGGLSFFEIQHGVQPQLRLEPLAGAGDDDAIDIFMAALAGAED
jgi:hypothetical protein